MYSQQSSALWLLVACLATLLAVSLALPPFEIRSSSNRKSEGAEQWIEKLQRIKACSETDSDQLTFLCHTTREWRHPECVFADMICDDHADCPNGEDEAAHLCNMFVKGNKRTKYPWGRR